MNAVVLVMRELVRWLFCVFSEVNRLSVHPVRQTAGWGYGCTCSRYGCLLIVFIIPLQKCLDFCFKGVVLVTLCFN